MKEKALAFAHKAWNDFKAFSPGQKAASVAALLALVVGGVLFSTWKSKPAYAPLYTNLAASDASSIIDKLNSSGVPYHLTNAGTEIDVPQSKVYSTRITLSAAGLPSSSGSGYSLLKSEGVTTSEFQQNVDYQIAVQDELNRTIEAINGIQTAAVHLAIPQQSVFNDNTQKPTASVLLTTSGVSQVTSQQIQAIAYLVSSSVPNMSSSDVTITDQNGDVLAAPGDDLNSATGMSTQSQATTAYDQQMTNELQSMIDSAVGAGHAKVVYNATLNFDKTQTTSSSYVYSSGMPPVSVQSSSERFNGNQPQAGGVLGASPTPSVATPSGGAGSYVSTNTIVNNALGTVTQTVDSAPGAVQKQAVSVLLDSSAKNVNVPAIQQLVSSAIGLNATRGDTLTVQALAFDTTAQAQQAAASAAAAKAAAAKAARDRQQAEIKEAAIAGIVLISIIVFFLMRRRKNKVTAAAQHQAEDYYDGWFDEQLLASAEPSAEEPGEMAAELAEAQARRRALVTLAEEQPDDVARVLSSWLNA